MKAMTIKDGVAAALPLGNVVAAQRESRTPALSSLPQPRPAQDADVNTLEPTIYRFVLKHSLPQQLLLMLLTLLSFPFLYFSLDLPKTIINRAIGGKQFPQTVFGIELGQITYLLLLCALFLVLVFINGGFKYYINTFK